MDNCRGQKDRIQEIRLIEKKDETIKNTHITFF